MLRYVKWVVNIGVLWYGMEIQMMDISKLVRKRWITSTKRNNKICLIGLYRTSIPAVPQSVIYYIFVK